MAPTIMSETLTVGRDTLVHINVHPADRDHEDFWLQYFPQRSGETTIFYTSPANNHRRSPTKPREVIWEVKRPDGASHLAVKLEAKQRGTKLLPQDDYEIKPGHNAIRSGEAESGPGRPQGEIVWRYSMVLLDGSREVHRIDPDIVIKEDP